MEEFNEEGLLIIKGFYDLAIEIEPIQYGIWKIIQLLITKYKVGVSPMPFSPQTFDHGYQELIAANRKYGGQVYDAVKQIPAFMRLFSLEKNELLFSQLRGTDMPGITADGLRYPD